jgi:hypothetical protein
MFAAQFRERRHLLPGRHGDVDTLGKKLLPALHPWITRFRGDGTRKDISEIQNISLVSIWFMEFMLNGMGFFIRVQIFFLGAIDLPISYLSLQ